MRALFSVILLAAAISVARGQTSVTAAVDDLLIPGRVALEDGLCAMAEQSFRSALDGGHLSESDAGLARQYLLQALFAQSKFDEMHSLLDGLTAKGLITGDTDVYWHAMMLYGQSRHAEAAALLDPFGAQWSQSRLRGPALRLQGQSRLKSGDVKGAAEAFSEFASNYPESDEANANRMDWVKALIFQGELQEAIRILQPIVSVSETNSLVSEARYWIGRAYLQSKATEKGLAFLKPLVSDPEVAEGLRVNAVLAVAGATTNSVAAAEGVIEPLSMLLAQVHGVVAKRSLAEALCSVLLKSGRVDEAIPLIKVYVSENPDAAGAAALQLRLGDALLGADRHAEAILAYQQYLEAFANAGGHARARQGLGWSLMGAERYAEASVAFEKAYELFADPEQKRLSLYKAGDARFANGQYQQALAVYDRFQSEFPGSTLAAKALFQRGACFAALAQQGEAEQAFEAVAATYAEAPEAEELLLRIAELRQALGDGKAAEAAFSRVMDRYPSGRFFARALHGRGMARYGQWAPDALEDFQRIVRNFPTAAVADHAYFMQAMCLYRLGRDAQALSTCQSFLERYTSSTWVPSVRFWMGRFAYNTGDYEVAESEFLSFAEKFPDHALADRAVYRAGMAAAKRKEYVRAIEIFGRLTKAYPTSIHMAEARFFQADAMCQLGKFAGAILVFEEVINNFPASDVVPLAWGRKGDCQFTLGAEDPARYEGAMRSYGVVTHSPQVRQDHIWQAEYKIGRCLEKLGQLEEAQERYYARVLIPYLMAKARGDPISESAKTWFMRASLGAADIVTAKKDWRLLVRILDRIVEADVAVSEEAKSRIKTIKAENWWLFY